MTRTYDSWKSEDPTRSVGLKKVARGLLVRDALIADQLKKAYQRLDRFFWPYVRDLEDVWWQSVLQASNTTKATMPDLAEWIVGQTITNIDKSVEEGNTERFLFTTLTLSYTIKKVGSDVVIASATRLDPKTVLNYQPV